MAQLFKISSLRSLALVVCLSLSVQSIAPQKSHAAAEREFIMSCTYGVLAGTLVGAASLAFTKQPGENLNRVARGASLGLYAGILLGLYVIYLVPNSTNDNRYYEQPELGLPVEESMWQRLQVFPVLSERGDFEGAAANWMVKTF